MAKCEVKLPSELMDTFSRLGERTDEIVARALEDGGNVVLARVKANLTAVVGKGTKHLPRSTGQLAASLGLSPVKQDRNGNSNLKIGFSEPRRGGGSNAMIANILENGKHGQPAKPFLKPAKSASRNACIEAMRVRLEQEISRL